MTHAYVYCMCYIQQLAMDKASSRHDPAFNLHVFTAMLPVQSVSNVRLYTQIMSTQ